MTYAILKLFFNKFITKAKCCNIIRIDNKAKLCTTTKWIYSALEIPKYKTYITD